MYPEAVYETVIASGWSDCDLKDAGEPTLWQKIPNELKQVTRFVFTEGHGSFFRFVTITEKLDGTGEMKIGGADHDKRDHATRPSSFPAAFPGTDFQTECSGSAIRPMEI